MGGDAPERGAVVGGETPALEVAGTDITTRPGPASQDEA